MKLWELTTLYATEILVYGNSFISKGFFHTNKHKYFADLVENYTKYENNCEVMNLEVPEDICIQYFSASKKLYFIRNGYLMEYFSIDEVSEDFFEEIGWKHQEGINIKNTITPLEVYKKCEQLDLSNKKVSAGKSH